MNKHAQTMTALAEAGQSLTKSAQGIPDQLAQLWSTLGDSQKQVIINGLLGGAVGGGAGGIGGALSENSTAASSGLMGALLGAIAGAGGTAGYNLLSGNQLMPSEESTKLPMLDSAMNSVAGGVLSNLATVAGTAAGGLAASRLYPSAARIREQLLKETKGVKAPNAGLDALAKKYGIPTGTTQSNSKAILAAASEEQVMKDIIRGAKRPQGTRQAILDAFRTAGPTPPPPFVGPPTGKHPLKYLPGQLRAAYQEASRPSRLLREAAKAAPLAKTPISRLLALSAIPAGAGLGYLADRHWKGGS